MKLFLDTSVLIAACLSSKGASRYIFDNAAQQGWTLLTAPFALTEVSQNFSRFPPKAQTEWPRLKDNLVSVPTILTIEFTTVFAVSKDRPILFTAFSWANVLLTLDQKDFVEFLGDTFYGLPILTPGQFLSIERKRGTLQ